MSEIANWYSGKNILITGVTGFIGTVLVEKLLRTCPDIKKMYLFVRSKKGKSTQERKEKVFQNALFDTVKSSNPDVFKKVIIINANFTKNSLNIPAEDELKLINDCDVIFHNAASVQFDRGLHDVYNTNVLGFKNLLELSKKMKNLKAFIFCSTAFSQYTGLVLEEKFYDSPMEINSLHQILDKNDNDTINILTTKILGKHANTYAFSKAVAERICVEYSSYFPIAIARPSIVVSMASDPIPGWTQGLNGFNGSAILASVGIQKVISMTEFCPRNIVPVDIVVNGLILIGWQTGIKKLDKIQYYNLAEDISSAKDHILNSMYMSCENAMKKYPPQYNLMLLGFKFQNNYILFKIMELWYHFLPAILVDFLLLLFGKKPMLIGIHRKLIYQLQSVGHYLQFPFMFKANNFSNLVQHLNAHDLSKYSIDMSQAFGDEYYYEGSKGIRKYLLKQSEDTMYQGRRLQKIFKVIEIFMYGLFTYWIIKYIYNNFM